MLLEIILTAWVSFSLGIVFSQMETGKFYIALIMAGLDRAGVKSRKGP